MALTVSSLVEADLLTNISQEELEGLTNEVLSLGQEDPVTWAITKQFDIMCAYVDFYTVKAQYEEALKDCWAKLAISGLYNRIARVPAKRREEREECIRFLTDIRDGKFPNMIVDEDSDAGAASIGTFGGCSRIVIAQPGNARTTAIDADDLVV